MAGARLLSNAAVRRLRRHVHPFVQRRARAQLLREAAVKRGAPPTATAVIGDDGSLHDYWLERARQHSQDSYAGVPMAKFPEDLRTYEHLLWNDAPDTVIEIGTQWGGSALWFRDRLRTLAEYGRIFRPPRVITLDVSQDRARAFLSEADADYASTIMLVEGDIRDPETAERASRLVGEARCFVVEDSAHEYETTMAALVGFARFVPPKGFLIVEDGCVDVDALRLDGWPRGVLPALHDWLTTFEGSAFQVRRDLELYGISCHPEGFLQRR
jgi:cephalosporin hydroxylase